MNDRLTSHHAQGIVTKYIGPTNYRGSRVSAKSRYHHIIIAWDDALNPYDNHASAAMALSYKMGAGRPSVECGPEWEFVGVESPSGTGYVFIMLDAPSAVYGCIRRTVDMCPLCGEDVNHPSQHGSHACSRK